MIENIFMMAHCQCLMESGNKTIPIKNKPKVCSFFLIFFLSGVLVLLAHVPVAYARDFSFSWTAPGSVDGYKLYYKTGSSGPPYDGIGAVEGVSPVTVGNVVSFTLHGLSDTGTYYYVITAIRAGIESDYSQELSSASSGATPQIIKIEVK